MGPHPDEPVYHTHTIVNFLDGLTKLTDSVKRKDGRHSLRSTRRINSRKVLQSVRSHTRRQLGD